MRHHHQNNQRHTCPSGPYRPRCRASGRDQRGGSTLNSKSCPAGSRSTRRLSPHRPRTPTRHDGLELDRCGAFTHRMACGVHRTLSPSTSIASLWCLRAQSGMWRSPHLVSIDVHRIVVVPSRTEWHVVFTAPCLHRRPSHRCGAFAHRVACGVHRTLSPSTSITSLWCLRAQSGMWCSPHLVSTNVHRIVVVPSRTEWHEVFTASCLHQRPSHRCGAFTHRMACGVHRTLSPSTSIASLWCLGAQNGMWCSPYLVSINVHRIVVVPSRTELHVVFTVPCLHQRPSHRCGAFAHRVACGVHRTLSPSTSIASLWCLRAQSGMWCSPHLVSIDVHRIVVVPSRTEWHVVFTAPCLHRRPSHRCGAFAHRVACGVHRTLSPSTSIASLWCLRAQSGMWCSPHLVSIDVHRIVVVPSRTEWHVVFTAPCLHRRPSHRCGAFAHRVACGVHRTLSPSTSIASLWCLRGWTGEEAFTMSITASAANVAMFCRAAFPVVSLRGNITAFPVAVGVTSRSRTCPPRDVASAA